jgi:hypothetical protein
MTYLTSRPLNYFQETRNKNAMPKHFVRQHKINIFKKQNFLSLDDDSIKLEQKPIRKADPIHMQKLFEKSIDPSIKTRNLRNRIENSPIIHSPRQNNIPKLNLQDHQAVIHHFSSTVRKCKKSIILNDIPSFNNPFQPHSLTYRECEIANMLILNENQKE